MWSACPRAAATTGVRLPNRLPRLRKFGFTVTCTRASASDSDSSDTTLSSSAICVRACSDKSCHRSAATSARDSGCRILIPDSARAARPSSTSRRTRAICASRSSSISAWSPSGHEARWTLSTPSEAANRSCHSRSVTKGTNGAMINTRSRRQVCSVCKAVASPDQNRRRERRTYQFDRSSISSAISLPAVWESKTSSAASTSRIVRWVRESSHRSISVGSPPPCPGCQSASPPYRAWNDAVLHKVAMTLLTTSCIASTLTRRACQGEPEASMNQRSASAPCASISGIGSRTLPRCLLILRPSASRMWPRDSTLL